MSENIKRWCVLVPCSKTQTWAVPLNCLAEVVTLHTDALSPPGELSWRDRRVPILDLGGDDDSQWRSEARGTGHRRIVIQKRELFVAPRRLEDENSGDRRLEDGMRQRNRLALGALAAALWPGAVRPG